MLAQGLVAAQEFEGAQQQFGEIDHAFALALVVVELVQLDLLALVGVVWFDLVGAQALVLGAVDEVHHLLGRNFSSSTLFALSRRLMTDSWSCESRIWKVCGSAASRWWVRSRRLHRPWKVPIHMPRVLIGIIADKRAIISFAALLVKVTARM